ncbi:MAG: Sua5/YciO/YrdC/YwlC family protein, partial [Oscillospiraceae bacterium]|nr:Sua5/YciO/YrdC/YwlC family protein [Oscillospiraceae bacterium]
MQFATKLLTASEADIEYAAELIKGGEVVGMPTETVYGLAADAENISAVEKIFKAKGRPQDNPL